MFLIDAVDAGLNSNEKKRFCWCISTFFVVVVMFWLGSLVSGILYDFAIVFSPLCFPKVMLAPCC